MGEKTSVSNWAQLWIDQKQEGVGWGSWKGLMDEKLLLGNIREWRIVAKEDIKDNNSG